MYVGEAKDLKIAKLELDNIRCFEHVEIDLLSSDKLASLAVVLGDNGVGKSTLLKSIVLGLSSPKVAPALFEATGTAWLRRGTTEGRIHLGFNSGESSEISIHLEPYGERITSHICTSEELLREEILVCGYGAARRAFGEKSFSSYSLREAVWSLFYYDARLQNPELMLRRLLSESNSPDGTEVLRWIDNVLLLPPGSTRLGQTGLEISGPWGDYTPVGALGDGYKATLAWVSDLLGWVLYRNYQMLQTGVRGIVLVDEIEQHLHPQWQRRIYQLLARQFPQVQFITTTHSPLCVIGTTDLTDDEVTLIHLNQGENAVQATSHLKPPRGMRADQVLTSYLFGLETTSDDQTKQEIGRLSDLLGKEQPRPEEQAEIEHLRTVLNQKLGTGETELERSVAALTEQALPDKLISAIGQTQMQNSLSEEAAKLEAKRQLKNLLSEL